MDQLIMTHSDKARVQVSYASLNNPYDQYHRNANLLSQSNDLIKLPAYLYALEQIELGFLEIDEVYKLRAERIEVNEQGLFGAEDVGRFVTTADILNGVAQFNDNAAHNILISRLDLKKFQEQLKRNKFNNTYLLKDLDDRSKHQSVNATNFIATGDLVNLQKATINRMFETRKGKNLLKKHLFDYKQDKSIALKEDSKLVQWREDTILCKGSNFIADGENGFILTILVSQFTSESEAQEVLEKAQKIYFSSFEKLSLN